MSSSSEKDHRRDFRRAVFLKIFEEILTSPGLFPTGWSPSDEEKNLEDKKCERNSSLPPLTDQEKEWLGPTALARYLDSTKAHRARDPFILLSKPLRALGTKVSGNADDDGEPIRKNIVITDTDYEKGTH